MIRSNTIRAAEPQDLDAVVEITKLNRQFHTPEVDGKEALTRGLSYEKNVFLVHTIDGVVTGFVLGSWDGARALIHKISVHPDNQGKGVGRALVKMAVKAFREMGAPTVGVTAADGTLDEDNDSVPFFEGLGFRSVAARLMVHFDIDDLGGD